MACHRCLLPFASPHEMDKVSRATAFKLLDDFSVCIRTPPRPRRMDRRRDREGPPPTPFSDESFLERDFYSLYRAAQTDRRTRRRETRRLRPLRDHYVAGPEAEEMVMRPRFRSSSSNQTSSCRPLIPIYPGSPSSATAEPITRCPGTTASPTTQTTGRPTQCRLPGVVLRPRRPATLQGGRPSNRPGTTRRPPASSPANSRSNPPSPADGQDPVTQLFEFMVEPAIE